MGPQVNEGNVRAPLSGDNLKMRHCSGNRAKSVIGNAVQAPTRRLQHSTQDCTPVGIWAHYTASFPEELVELPTGSLRQ